MTNEELTAVYVDLLIIQYADPNLQPNAAAVINLMAGEAIANQVVGQVLNGFALSNIYGQTPGVGAQLDILGEYVGAQRILPGYSPTIIYFGMQDTTGVYNSSAGGYGSVNNVTPPSDYWDSTDQVEGQYVLSDQEMISLIGYLTAVNSSYYSVEEIDQILYEFFGTYVTLSEPIPMEVEYTNSGFTGTLYGIIKYLNALPHPAGVEVVTN